ncbi:hypothetical protein [uncultured Rikenella sp.]|uniref:hypothetical protein n=1 Tax=uncultured Rikenella sp. TaxID=368003 RepID=UPI002614A277|nr:hypothetical protein [uncultured Rikenella sp.]
MEIPIGAYLDDYTLLDGPGVSAQLHELVKAYPWFSLGRYMELRSLRESDPAGYSRALRRADVRLFVHPYPRLLLDEPAFGQAAEYGFSASGQDAGCRERPDTVSVIDEFLNGGDAAERIVPPPPGRDDPQEDISADSVTDDGEIATETLAGIYMAQGQTDRAIEIYYRLSLKYPEKSAYFAHLIADLQACRSGR